MSIPIAQQNRLIVLGRKPIRAPRTVGVSSRTCPVAPNHPLDVKTADPPLASLAADPTRAHLTPFFHPFDVLFGRNARRLVRAGLIEPLPTESHSCPRPHSPRRAHKHRRSALSAATRISSYEPPLGGTFSCIRWPSLRQATPLPPYRADPPRGPGLPPGRPPDEMAVTRMQPHPPSPPLVMRRGDR